MGNDHQRKKFLFVRSDRLGNTSFSSRLLSQLGIIYLTAISQSLSANSNALDLIQIIKNCGKKRLHKIELIFGKERDYFLLHITFA